MRTHSICAALSMAIFSTVCSGAQCSAHSTPTRTVLLELYTSEGCSSCPPADHWLSQLSGSKSITEKVVPLAFHVDYWDYIGWKDRFAKPEFSARQKRAATLGFSGFVYTPQVMLNGHDYSGWQNTAIFTKTINQLSSEPSRANITLEQSDEHSGAINLVTKISAADASNTDVYLAIYENDLKSTVNAGENKGQELKHDAVVREFFGPYKLNYSQAIWQKKITLQAEWQKRNAGVAAFIQNRTSGEILQVLAMKLCD